MRKQFRDSVLELAKNDPNICMLLGDVSVYLFNEFKEKYESNFYNLGICENTLISVAAGLSSRGFSPFVHTIAPFITDRCVEQIKLDACYNDFPINIVSCGSSFDYAWDGATHHTLMDLKIISMIPNTEVIQPGSNEEVKNLIKTQYSNNKTTYFRLSDNPHSYKVNTEFGKGTVLQDKNSQLTVVTAGPLLSNVYKAVEELPVNLIYFHTLKPIDEDLLNKFSKSKFLIVSDAFGLFEIICQTLNGSRIYNLTNVDQFADCYGNVEDVRHQFGLSVNKIKQKVQKFLINL